MHPRVSALGCSVVLLGSLLLSGLAYTQPALHVRLAWDAPKDAPAGTAYHVYRRTDGERDWQRLTRAPVPQGTEAAPWIDRAPRQGKNLYYVVSVLEGWEDSQGSNMAGVVLCVTTLP